MARRRRRGPSLGQAASCVIPRSVNLGVRRNFDPIAGIEGLEYLKARSRKDPFFALASAFMHAGQITYQTQQPIVEQLVADPEREKLLGDGFGAEEMLLRRYKGAIYARDKARAWPMAIHCWQKFCKTSESPNGEACLARGGRLTARAMLMMRCLERKLPHGSGTRIGRKSRNLLAEYLGCDLAVAVDRHVANWLSNSAGTLAWAQKVFFRRDTAKAPCPSPFKKELRGPRNEPICAYDGRVTFVKEKGEADKVRKFGMPATAAIDPGKFAMMKREIQTLAGSCGLKPAELQVAAWAQGACDALAEGGMGTKLILGAGNVLDCNRVPRVDLGAPPKAFKLGSVPKPVPGPTFRCKPGYLGAGATKVEEIDLVTKPVRPSFGIKLEYDEKIYPVVPESRLAVWAPGFQRRSRVSPTTLTPTFQLRPAERARHVLAGKSRG